MLKPNGYDNARIYGNYEQLPAGNYECIVVDVKETTSKAGNPMLLIFLDIAAGEYAGFFQETFKNDNRTDKKWPCIFYQSIYDRDGNCTSGFKTFIHSLAESNANFDEARIWGDYFRQTLQKKTVGASFRREQYENKNGKLCWSTKCAAFFPVDEIEKRDVMPDKFFEQRTPTNYGSFQEMASDDDGDLPF